MNSTSQFGKPPEGPAQEKYFTPRQLAERYQVSAKHIMREFCSGYDGVINISIGKRRNLRIPESAVLLFQERHAVRAQTKVQRRSRSRNSIL